jgi:putative hemolysin
MLKLVHQIKVTSQMTWNRVNKMNPTFDICIDAGPYQIKLARTAEELLKIFRLRHEVFQREFREIAKVGLDIDKFDRSFDHLYIAHKPTNQIVGTYRLRASTEMLRSYTALEFQLEALNHMEGPFLELGRACVHKEFRKGVVMSLLFRGLAEYMNKSDAKILFGCSSVKTQDPREAALVHSYLRDENHLRDDFEISPTIAFEMPMLDYWLDVYSDPLRMEWKEEARKLIPTLVHSYLKMGAKIASEPAFDRDYSCIDLLTVLNKEDLAASLVRRFQVIK